MTAAGAVGGTLLPSALAWGRYAVRTLSERSVLQRDPELVPSRLVEHAVQSRFLTLAGLKAQVSKLESVHSGNPFALAYALAGLAAAVPVAREDGCSPCSGVAPAQLDYLLQTLVDLQLQLALLRFDQALFQLASNLRSDALTNSVEKRAVLVPGNTGICRGHRSRDGWPGRSRRPQRNF